MQPGLCPHVSLLNGLLQASIARTPCPAASVAEARAAGRPLQPSVIVCPSTLVGHWVHEISKFVGPDLLQPLQYQGTPGERGALQSLMGSHNVLVLGYEVSCQQGTLGTGTRLLTVHWFEGARGAACGWLAPLYRQPI